MSYENASRFIVRHVRALIDLRAEPMNGPELPIPAGAVFAVAANVAESGHRDGLLELAGVPGKSQASVVATTRGDEESVRAAWEKSQGRPYFTAGTGFFFKIRRAPVPLPSQPTLCLGPVSPPTLPKLPDAFNDAPVRID